MFQSAPAGAPAPPASRRKRLAGATGATVLSAIVLAVCVGGLAFGGQHWLRSASDCNAGSSTDLRTLETEVLSKVPAIPPGDIVRVSGCEADGDYPAVGWSTEAGTKAALGAFVQAGWRAEPERADGATVYSYKLGDRQLIVTGNRSINENFDTTGTDVVARFR